MPAATNSLSPQPVQIRIAQSADAPAVAQLINAAFLVERVAFDRDRIDTQGVREFMQKGPFLIADDTTGLSGCVYVEIHGARSYLGLLSVAPARQGTGLGRRLVAAAEECACKAACHTMDLRIISPRAESLLPLYQHLGYAQNGTAAFPAEVTTKVPCHYILMAKTLR
jgi:GNAT superfamily N-acetyltransferase